jgi:hypothetical protein
MLTAFPVTISVIPTPTLKSLLRWSNASLVTLPLGSSITTSPMRSEEAKDLVAAGSDKGLSLSSCG